MLWALTFVTTLLVSVSAFHESERVNRFHELRANPTATQIEEKITAIKEIISNRTAAALNISAHLAGSSDLAAGDLPWVAGIYEDFNNGPSAVGLGVIVSKHWIIANVITVYIMSDLTYVWIVAGAADIFDQSTFHAHPREFHWYPQDTGSTSNTEVFLSLIKFCPGVPPNLIVPNAIPSSFPMNVHDTIVIASYDPYNIKKTSVLQNVGYPCECEWLNVKLSQIFCLTPDQNTGPTNVNAEKSTNNTTLKKLQEIVKNVNVLSLSLHELKEVLVEMKKNLKSPNLASILKVVDWLNIPTFGINGPWSPKLGEVAPTFRIICYSVKNEDWKVKSDKSSMFYAHNDDSWVSYEDFSSIISKISLAKSLRIGSVMIWDSHFDDAWERCGCGFYPLLTAVNSEIRRINHTLKKCT